MNRDDRITFQIKTLDGAIRKKMNCRMQLGDDDDFTPMQGWIIGFLCARSGEAVYQKDVEAAFRVSRATVSNMLKLMEKKGLITRESVSHDARLKKLALTEKAVSLHTATMRFLDGIENTLASAITPEERDSLLIILAKLRRALSPEDEQEPYKK